MQERRAPPCCRSEQRAIFISNPAKLSFQVLQHYSLVVNGVTELFQLSMRFHQPSQLLVNYVSPIIFI